MTQKNFTLFGFLVAAALSASAQQTPLDESNSCIAALQDDPKIKIISAKLPFDIFSQPTLEVMANKTKPTPKEKLALSYLNVEREKCIDIGNEFRLKNFPIDVQALATTFRSNSVATLVDLYAGKISFGEAARVRAKIAADFRMSLDSLVKKYQAQDEIRQRQNQEAEERNRQLQARQLQYEQQMELLRQQYQAQLEAQQAQVQAQQQALTEARRQQGIANGLQLLQMARPQVPAMMPNNSFNCRSRVLGGGLVTTDCN